MLIIFISWKHLIPRISQDIFLFIIKLFCSLLQKWYYQFFIEIFSMRTVLRIFFIAIFIFYSFSAYAKDIPEQNNCATTVTQKYSPRTFPLGLVAWQLVYSKCSPERNKGCWPTTPSPRTSWTSLSPSVMNQWRAISWMLADPVLRIVTV